MQISVGSVSSQETAKFLSEKCCLLYTSHKFNYFNGRFQVFLGWLGD